MNFDLKMHKAKKRIKELPWDVIETQYTVEGINSPALAKQYQTTPQTILKGLRKRGVETRRQGTVYKYTPEMFEEAERLRDLGWPAHKVALHLNIGIDSLYKKVSFARNIEIDDEELESRYNNGASIAKLAAHYKVSASYIRKRLSSLGGVRHAQPAFDPTQIAPLEELKETLEKFLKTERGKTQEAKLRPQIEALAYCLERATV